MTRREIMAYVAAISLSLVAHVGLFEGLGHAARTGHRDRNRVLEFAVFEPPPPPAPEPEPDKPKPPSPEPPPVDLTEVAVPIPDDVPPPPNTDAGEEEPEQAPPVFGVTMSSVVGPGSDSGFKVRVGNTLMKEPEEEFTRPEEVKAYEAVPLYKVTRQPKFERGVCKPEPYPPQAKQMGIEGRVELEVELRADGTVGDVKLISGLGFDIDAAAIAAIKNCPFTPGEIAGKQVTTRITVGITFIIED
jgi:protein TonB